MINDEKYLAELHTKFGTYDVDLDSMKIYIDELILEGKNSLQRLMAYARYFKLNNNENYIYFTKLLGGIGVIENIRSRVAEYAGEDKEKEIFEEYSLPPLGITPEKMSNYGRQLIDLLNLKLERSLIEKILSGNNHNISKEHSLKERKLYKEIGSLEMYLQVRHMRKVKELEDYMKNDEIWFEQIITKEVVDYVKSNQEILSGVVENDILYVTKIPYDTLNYINAKQNYEKRYFLCHCPFARESILNHNQKISSNWCYCSAGFAKFPFEIILEKELDVKVLESALAGDLRCRFAIKIK